MAGDTEGVQKALAEHVSPNIPNRERMPPLVAALVGGPPWGAGVGCCREVAVVRAMHRNSYVRDYIKLFGKCFSQRLLIREILVTRLVSKSS